jgi:nucleoside-triphosphatase THEP1
MTEKRPASVTVIVTGDRGSGKSTMLKRFDLFMREQGYRPSTRAYDNLSETTIYTTVD